MNTTHDVQQHTLDAKGRRLGRVATEAAHLLMGKDRTDVTRNNLAPVEVTITNVSKLLIDEAKRTQKTYDRYTGYPDGRRVLTMEKLIDKKGYAEVMRKAVFGMLPSNKLRAPRMKQLIITE